jgi:acetylornithine deacetylase/succinyl-diaminopimelate desuccinylase-like protein
MAHSDVVPADRSQWSVDPYRAELIGGFVYGRGAIDDKSLLAVQMAVLVELRRRDIRLRRDVIVLAEADEEAGSTGIRWLIENAWSKIDAEFALNEGGYILKTDRGRLFNVQVAEKVPSRVTLIARGTAGHGSLPRPDNPVLRLARALTKLADADQPVRLNPITRRYLKQLSKLDDFSWLAPLLVRLENPATANAAANQIRARDPEIEAMLRTAVAPTMLRAGKKINVIPNVAEAHVDVRRLPNESPEEIVARFRQIINDSAVEVSPTGSQQMPATEPSPLSTALYRALERVFRQQPNDIMLPYMSRGATDSSFLRARGMPVYGVPLFAKEGDDNRVHGNDERISLKNIDEGATFLWRVVIEAAAQDQAAGPR